MTSPLPAAPSPWARPRLLARALPRGAGLCAVCQGWASQRLCAHCLQQFAPVVPRCGSCGLRVPAGVAHCGHCLHTPPPLARCLCLADYGFPWDRLISRFKFGQQPELALGLAEALHERAQAADMPCPDLFAPVPLSARRLADRGYDQAWELARRLAPRAGRPGWPRLLQRRFDSRAQSSLDRQERLSNLRGAFVVAASAQALVPGARIGLVDDVMTTGATAHEAARTLLAAGAARVDLWLLARTPAPQD